MWSFECIGSSLQGVSYWHRAIGIKCPPPPRVWLNRSLLEYVEFGALGLFSIISPSFELEIERRFFFWIPYSLGKYLKIFYNF